MAARRLAITATYSPLIRQCSPRWQVVRATTAPRRRLYASGPSASTTRSIARSPDERRDIKSLRHLVEGDHDFFAALPLDAHGKPFSDVALSLDSRWPPQASQVELLSLEAQHPGARQAFWLVSAYLLGAALEQLGVSKHRVMLAGMPKLLEETAQGGTGFSYEYMLLKRGDNEAGPSTTPSSYREAVHAVATLMQSRAAKPVALTDKDKAAIQQRISEWVNADAHVERAFVSRAEAIEIFASNPFKLERIWATAGHSMPLFLLKTPGPTGAVIHRDLAPPPSYPLLDQARRITALAVTDWSTATFTPTDASAASVDELPTTQWLNNVRGWSHPSKEVLEARLKQESDMKQQGREGGHLAIGKSQSLFMTHAHSAGSPFLLPHGTRLARRVERVIRDLYDVHDYDEVITPQIYRKKLWEQSGHWDNYREDMFGVEGFKEQQRKEMKRAAKIAKVIEERRGCCAAHDAEGSGQSDASTSASASTSTPPLPDMDFGLKPMNCPGHCLIYSSQPRSLSDLPLRFSEWSPLHRNEPSGSLSGLTRVRRFVQDDAHVFCAPEQIKAEIATMLTMLSDAYSVFGFPNFEVVLSTRPSKSLGRQEDWDRAEQALQEALDEAGVRWTCNHGDGAFYGPKIDIRLVDSLQRKHQTATIQLDFQLPERFGLTYEPGAAASAETTSVHRPVMIHRAILGSVERFLAILMESREGAWPFWLSPRQACIIPVTTSPEVLAYCEKVRKQLSLGLDYEAEDGGVAPRSLQRFFVEMSPPSSLDMRLSKRIKRAQLAGYNFLIIVGEGEMKASTVKVTRRAMQAFVEGNGSWWKRLRSSAADGVEAQLFGESGELSSSGEREAGQMEMGSYEVGKLRALWEKMDRCHL